jgi:hypothetical protein
MARTVRAQMLLSDFLTMAEEVCIRKNRILQGEFRYVGKK